MTGRGRQILAALRGLVAPLPAAALALAVGALALWPAPAAAQPDTYFAGVVQHQPDSIAPTQVVSRFTLPMMSGGINDFSGIHSADGNSVLLLSDHGFIVSAQLQRGYGQRIEGIQLRQVALLLDEAGHPLSGSMRDSEGIAVGPDGRIYIAFEENNRVLAYRQLGGRAESLGVHRDFARLRVGNGLESLAISRDGSLYAIPERPARATYGFPAYRWFNGTWEGAFRLPMDGLFLPVGADFGPDGLLYVLERERSERGYRSQVRRFAVRGQAISQSQWVMRSDYGQFGNLEGLSVFRDWNGRIRLLMVSDDDRGMAGRSELIDVVVNR